MRSAIALTAILAVALVIRFAWSSWTDPIPPPLSDSDYYNATALSLAHGEGYSVVFDAERGFLPGGEATAFWPPGYSAFLAVFYGLFGEGVDVAKAANVFVGALIVVPIYFIGLRFFGRGTATIGAAIAAALPSLIFWVPVLLSDTLFTLLFATTVALLLYAMRPDRSFNPILVAISGVALAAAALVRGQALVLVPVAVASWALAGAKPTKCFLWGCGALAVATIAIAPWSIRNIRTMKSPILLSANMGYNLRIGHAPYSTGRYIVPQDLWDANPKISTFKEREPVFNDLGTDRAVKYALGHPGEELELTARKVMWLWRPDSDALTWVSSYGRTPLPEGAWEPLRRALDSSYVALLALVGCGLLRIRSLFPQLAFLIILIPVWTATHIVFFGEPRYHLPVLAVMVPVAAASLVWLWQGARRASYCVPSPSAHSSK